MRKTLIRFGYELTMRGDWISDLWSRIWFRWWCPYPVNGNWTVKACRTCGDCGCNNNPVAT